MDEHFSSSHAETLRNLLSFTGIDLADATALQGPGRSGPSCQRHS